MATKDLKKNKESANAEIIPKSSNTDMSFWGHLDVLRFSLMRSFGVVFLLAVGAFYFADFIYAQVILGPKNPDFITNIYSFVMNVFFVKYFFPGKIVDFNFIDAQVKI